MLNEYCKEAGLPHMAYTGLQELPPQSESFGYDYFVDQKKRNAECDYSGAKRCPCEPCKERRAACMCVACMVNRDEDPLDGARKRDVVRSLRQRASEVEGTDKDIFLDLAALVNGGQALVAVSKAFHAGISLADAIGPVNRSEVSGSGGKAAGGSGKKKRRSTALKAGPTAPPISTKTTSGASSTTRSAAAVATDASEGRKRQRRNKRTLDDAEFPCSCGGSTAHEKAVAERKLRGGSGRGGKPTHSKACRRGIELRRRKEAAKSALVVE
jgi:hypothetical protein